MQNILITLVGSFLLAPFRVNFIDLNVQRFLFWIIVFTILVLWFMVAKKGKLNVEKNVAVAVAFYLVLCGLAWLVPILYGTYDFGYFEYLIRNVGVVLCWFSFVICSSYFKSDSNLDIRVRFVDCYSSFIFLYVGFTLLCFTCPEFRRWWLGLLYAEGWSEILIGNALDEVSASATRISWNGFTGHIGSFFCSLGVLLSLWKIYFLGKRASMLLAKSYFIIAWSLLGNFLMGRTGLVCSLSMIFVFVCHEMLIYGSWESFAFIISLCVFGMVFVNVFQNGNFEMQNMYQWAFSPILNYLDGNGLTTGSTDILFNQMYWIPNLDTILWGDGKFLEGINSYSHYMGTDAGIMRMILFWGIFPTILVYLLTMGVIKKIFFAKGIFLMLTTMLFVVNEVKNDFWPFMFAVGLAILLLDMIEDKHNE